MSETPDPMIPPPPVGLPPLAVPDSPGERLYQAAAWVAIIAGLTMIAVVVFKFAWVLGY